jgi:hypothetical protein
MTTQAVLFTTSALSLLVAVLAAFRERRRNKRHNLDDVGWVPWTLIMVIAFGVAAISFGYALKVK